MLTSQMPALTRAMSGVLPPLALKQLTQALGNCNQEVTHRGQVSFAPDGWQNAQNNNGLYSDFPPTADQYNQFYNNVVNEGDSYFNNVNNVNNNSYNTNNEFLTNIVQGGPPGRDGRDGLEGLLGRDGINGSDGERGTAGDAGPAGPPGNPGAAGGNGRDGRDGAGDQAGQAGQAGPAGQPGGPGAAGPGGRDGRDGRGVEGLGTKGFVQRVQPRFQELPRTFITFVKSATFNESTCKIDVEYGTATAAAAGTRVCTEVNADYGTAYAP
jgi:hypothetical protein